VLNMLRSHPKS